VCHPAFLASTCSSAFAEENFKKLSLADFAELKNHKLKNKQEESAVWKLGLRVEGLINKLIKKNTSY
jgi:hypothetical protein